MAINKVVLNNEVQLDLTADTVTADKLLKGYTAHDKSGASIVGTYEGGSTPPPSPTDDNASVIFVDYDGTLLETWTKDEVAGKTALPTPPAHEGLVFEEWNWSLADIQGDTTGQVITVAPYYHTSSGFVEIDIELNEGTSKTAYLFTDSMVGRTIDWGDGTTSNTEKAHTYENYGSYTVKVPAQSGALSRVLFDSAMVQYYGKPVKAIRCNQDVTDLNYFKSMGLAIDVVLNKAFAVGSYKTNICCGKLFHKIDDSIAIYNYGIEYISIKKDYTSTLFSVSINQDNEIKSIYIPSNVTSIGNSAFSGCYSLQSITIPNSVTSIGSGTFQLCQSLQSINIPDSVESIGRRAFYNCQSLQSITIPNSVTSISENAFSGCQSLQSITIPNSVTSIGRSAFYNCYNIRYAKINTTAIIDSSTYEFCTSSEYINTTYDFSEVTAIPILSSTSSLNSSSYITAIIVPDALYDDWIVATNWPSFASKIKKASEYTYQ